MKERKNISIQDAENNIARWLLNQRVFPISWSEELKEIFRVRLMAEVREHIFFMGGLKINAKGPLSQSIEKFDEAWPIILTNIGQNVYNRLKREVDDFKKHNKKIIFDVIQKAKKGDRRSIHSLVEWDKTWIGMPFVQKIIADRQYHGDTLFFKNLGNALGKKPKVTKKAKEERILTLIRLLSRFTDLNQQDARKRLHDFLNHPGNNAITAFGQDDGDVMSKLSEFKYFTTVLKRHGIIKREGDKKT